MAQAKLEADQAALAKLQAGPSDLDVASAKAKIAVDQATLDGLKSWWRRLTPRWWH